MRVTLLEADRRSGGGRVQVDGRPFGTIAAGDVAALGLRRDAELDDRAGAALTARAEIFGVRGVALRLLASRSLPAAELVRRLVRRGHPRPAAEIALEQLREAGLVDDAAFARSFVSARARSQRLGPRRLLAELRRLGVDGALAESAVTDALAADGVDSGALLRDAALKKARGLQRLDPETARRRLRAYLMRRGFAGAEVAAVVKEALPR
jgi:regulatory protein